MKNVEFNNIQLRLRGRCPRGVPADFCRPAPDADLRIPVFGGRQSDAGLLYPLFRKIPAGS